MRRFPVFSLLLLLALLASAVGPAASASSHSQHSGSSNASGAMLALPGLWIPADGPAGRRTLAVAVSPDYQHDGTAFAGLDYGGLWRTTDGGTTWTGANPPGSIPADPVADIALSPGFDADDTLLLAFDSAGEAVYRSTDRGASWAAASGLPHQDRRVKKLVLSPDYNLSGLAYAVQTDATTGNPAEVWTSGDGGLSWTAASGWFSGTAVVDLALTPTFPYTGSAMFAIQPAAGLWRSTDGGVSFARVGAGTLPDELDRVVTAADYLGGVSIWVLAGGAAWFSSDGGDAWAALSMPADLGPGTWLAPSPGWGDPYPVLYAGSATAGQLYKSTDAGVTWTAMATELPDQRANDAALFFRMDNDVLYLAGALGIYRSLDSGATWSLLTGGLPAAALKDIAWPKGDPTQLFLATEVQGDQQAGAPWGHVERSTDAGQTWQPISPQWPDPVLAIALSPNYTADGTIFAGIGGFLPDSSPAGGLLRSTDFGQTWEMVNSGQYVDSIAISPNFAADGTLFHSSKGPNPGLWKSIDRGDSWALIAANGFGVSNIAISPDYKLDSTLWATWGPALRRSTDGGATWQEVAGQAVAGGTAVHPAFGAAQTVYSEWEGSMLRSGDGGMTFVPDQSGIDLGAPDEVHSFSALTYGVDGTVLAAVEYNPPSGDSHRRVYRSAGPGMDWQEMSGEIDGLINALTEVPPSDIASKAAWAATEAGLWRFDDVRDFFPPPCYGSFSDDIVANGGFEQVGVAWTTPDTPFPADWSDLVVHGFGRWSMRVGIANGDVGNPPPLDGEWQVAGGESPTRRPADSHSRIPAYPTDEGVDLVELIRQALGVHPGEDLTGRRGKLPIDALAQLEQPAGPAGYAYSSARQEVLIPADAMTATLELEQYPASSDQGAPGSINTDAQYGLAIEADGSFTVLYWDYRLNDQRWLHRQIDMLPYRGRPITLHFGTRNQGDSLRTVQFVDDVHLWVCSPPPPPPPLPPNVAALGEDFLVTDAASAQYDPAAAFNGEDDEFLVVWEDFRAGGLPDIWSQRVSYDGRLLGDAVPLVVDSDIQSDPQVAYLASADRYLVVWQDNRNGPDSPDVYGQLVRRDGLPDGPNFSVAAGPGGQVSVRIAASSADNSWLVVWGDATAGSSSVKAQRVSGVGALVGPVIAVSDGSGWAGQPTVAYSTAAATYFVAWVDNRSGNTDIYAQKVRLDGVLLGSNFAVSSDPGVQEWPSVSVSGWDYTVLVAWQDWRNGGRDIYGHHLAADGTLVGTDFAIAALPGNEDMATVANWPDAAQNEFLVVWQAPLDNGDLHGQRVAAGGGLVGDPVIISDEPHTQANPAVAVAHTAADPSFLVVWEDYRAASNAGIYGQRLDQDGLKKEHHVGLTPLDGIQTRPAVAYSEISDRYLVAWEQQEEGGSLIMAYTLDGDGRLVSWPAILSTVTIATDPAVAWDSANDRFLVVWRDVGQTTGIDIRGQLVAPNGSLLGGNLVVSDAPGEQRAPAVAYGGSLGRYLVVFEDLRDDDGSGESVDVYGQFLDSGGVPLFTLTDTNFPVSTPSGAGQREERPHLAYDLPGNSFLVVWQDSRNGAGLSLWDVYGRLVDEAAGVPLGPEFVIADQATHNEHSPRVAKDDQQGQYLVVWEDVDMAADGDPDIYGRLLDLTGSPLSSPLAIAAGAHWEGAPDVAFGRGQPPAVPGRYLVVWYDTRHSGDPSLPDIYGRQLRSNGGFETGPLAISTAQRGQWWPVVAARQDRDEWLVAWEDERAERPAVYALRQAVTRLVYLPEVRAR